MKTMRILTTTAMLLTACASTAIGGQERDASAPQSVPSDASGHVLAVATDEDVLPGVVGSRHAVTLGVNFDAMILAVLVEEGQRVSRGDVIARLDDRAARAAMELAQQEASQTARVQRARIVLDRARRVHERVRVAQARGAATAEELADAATDVEIAQADLAEAAELQNAAALRLTQARVQVERHLIRAPFDGTVIRLPAEPGAIVTSGDPIAELIDADRLRVDLFLPAATARAVTPGDRYAVRLHAPTERVVWATARFVEPRIEPTSGTVRTTFEFDLPGGALHAGTLVTPASREPNAAELAFMAGRDETSPALATQTGNP